MISLSDLRQFKQQGRKISCLTCYDASMAKAMELAEIEGAMSSLAIAVTGILTVVFSPLFMKFI